MYMSPARISNMYGVYIVMSAVHSVLQNMGMEITTPEYGEERKLYIYRALTAINTLPNVTK